ncbi:MAG: DegT/DnrJ/EryC1/StrS aminotransferase family protein [Gemmatimonadetes bacterium]|nr:DegT/DnrJ/EryC1/StrS aminotransferase family protein [Gemmatimonadota bacterium]
MMDNTPPTSPGLKRAPQRGAPAVPPLQKGAVRERWSFRRQPPVFSPLSVRALLHAAAAASGRAPDPRPGLQRLLAATFVADRVELTGSGTQALELAMRTVWWRAGTDAPSVVALPAFGCFDIATAAVGSGLSIALYDVDPDTLTPDLDSLRSILAGGVKIVVVAHLFGYPIDWNGLQECAAPFGAVLIEDAAQGHGARWWERPAGALGSLSILSFGRGKGWTGSRGGALLQRGPAALDAPPHRLANPVPRDEASALGTALAQWMLGTPGLYWLPASIPALRLGETRYREPVPLSRMTRAAAAMIWTSGPLATTEMFARRSNAWELLARLPFSDHVRPLRRQLGGDPGFLRLPLRLSHGLAGFRDAGHARRLGIAASYPSTLGQLEPVRERLVGPETHWPGAEILVRELVTLPTHSRLTNRDKATLVRVIEEYRRTPEAR